MKDKEKTFAIILIIMGFVACGIFLLIQGIDYGFLHSEITSYPVYCLNKDGEYVTYNPNCLRKEAGIPTVYKIYPEQQEVISDSKYTQIKRLTGCAVKNRKNWSCNNGEFGFINGKYFDSSSSYYSFVSRWEWFTASH